MEYYDIFISYKRKSLPTANNLYYRLTTRGYSTFFDLEEMRRDNFNVQLLNYIENAKDVFVILEEGSLDACKRDDWEKDWFCHEIAIALEKKKNIIPILLGGYQMPPEDFFPDRLKEFHFKESPDFNFSYFEAYLDKLVEKEFLLSKPSLQTKATSIFKFYSDKDCQVYKEGKIVCSLEGMSDEPYYLPVPRKGDYRFKGVNIITKEQKIIKEHIDVEEEKDIEIVWEQPENNTNNDRVEGIVHKGGNNHIFTIKNGLDRSKIITIDDICFNMIYVESGKFFMGATDEQGEDAYFNERPVHQVKITKPFYICETPITQDIWTVIQGSNPSYHEGANLPVECVSWIDIQSFLKNLNNIVGLKFRLPTESEWEYAARGGKKSKSYKYSGSNIIDEVAWYEGNSNGTTHPVKQKRPNEIGLYDMSGNVYEWCNDWYGEFNNGWYGNYDNGMANINPQGPREGTLRVCRGGGWDFGARICRVSFRDSGRPDRYNPYLGFRIVCD